MRPNDAATPTSSDDAPHLEEALEIIDLADRHRDEHERLEEGPEDDARVGALVDRPVHLVTHRHVVLFVLDRSQRRRQLLDHFLQFRVIRTCDTHRQLQRALARPYLRYWLLELCSKFCSISLLYRL